MRLAYQYKLLPTAQQRVTMNKWLDMLRHQYNWMLADRFDWWEMNRCPVNACPLVCSIAEPREQPEYYGQKRALVPLKQDRPWYKEIHSQGLQDMVKRVKLAFDRYIVGDSNGKRSGRPRFKGAGRYRSFTYPQASIDWIDGNKIELPKIGALKVVWHRPLPDGFVVKSAIISHKADGWYITLSLEDKSVPESTPDVNWDNAVGIDLGLKDFLVTSNNERVEVPKYFRKSQKKLAKLQRFVSRKKKGSNRYKKAVNRVAKLHQKIARQRKDFHFKIWTWLLEKYDVIIHEKLNIKGLARTRLAKSVLDAGWGQFLEIGKFKAERAGRLTIPENPNGTSIDCSGCGERVPKTLADRVHDCPTCGLFLCRDLNAAINIKQRAVGHQARQLTGNVLTEVESHRRSPRCTA